MEDARTKRAIPNTLDLGPTGYVREDPADRQAPQIVLRGGLVRAKSLNPVEAQRTDKCRQCRTRLYERGFCS